MYFPDLNLKKKITERITQSLLMPIQTPSGPVFSTRIRKIVSATRQVHIVTVETSIGKRTSPVARIPYGGIKEKLQAKGFITCTKTESWIVKSATSVSIPERTVSGFTIPITITEEIATAIKLKKVSFLMYFSASL